MIHDPYKNHQYLTYVSKIVLEHSNSVSPARRCISFPSLSLNFLCGLLQPKFSFQCSSHLYVYISAVARGGAGGARAPSVFYLKSKNRPT